MCPGAKTREQIYEAFEKIYPVLKQFKKGDVEPQAEARDPADAKEPAGSLQGRAPLVSDDI